MTNYVLDSSALLTLRNNEAGADQVEQILREGQKGRANLFVSFITYTEIFYILWRRRGPDEAYKVILQLKTLPIRRIDPDEKLLLLAGELKALYPISLGDSFIAATAIQKQARLVHKDPEFKEVEERVELMNLPYKK